MAEKRSAGFLSAERLDLLAEPVSQGLTVLDVSVELVLKSDSL